MTTRLHHFLFSCSRTSLHPSNGPFHAGHKVVIHTAHHHLATFQPSSPPAQLLQRSCHSSRHSISSRCLPVWEDLASTYSTRNNFHVSISGLCYSPLPSCPPERLTQNLEYLSSSRFPVKPVQRAPLTCRNVFPTTNSQPRHMICV